MLGWAYLGADGMKIEIVNWDKYNPRTDAKAWSWFRMQNSFFDDPDLFDLGVVELISFVYLCCERSKSGEDPAFKINPRQMAQKCRCKEKDVRHAIDALEAIGRVVVHERRPDPNVHVRPRTDPDVHVPMRPDPRATNVTNVTNETDGTNTTAKQPGPRVIARTRNGRALTLAHSEADLAVGRAWLAFALTEMPWKADDPSWTPERFAEHLSALRRATGVSEEGLALLLAFVAKDEFWRKNACSPAGLLKKSARNGERKIDNILVRMRTSEDRTRDTMAQWAEENA